MENRNGRARWWRKSIERFRAGDVAAERADRLRERAHLDVDAAVQPEVIDGAAAVAAEHAAGVRVVDHHDAAELVGDVAELRQRAEVTIHAEHAVGDDQPSPVARQFLDDRRARPSRRDAETP